MTQKIGNQTFLSTNQYLKLTSSGKVLHIELSKPEHKIGREPPQEELR